MTTSVDSRLDAELDDDDVHELSAEQERDPSIPGLPIYLVVGVVFGVERWTHWQWRIAASPAFPSSGTPWSGPS